MSPARPWIASYRAPDSACLASSAFLPDATPLALLGERVVEAGPIHADAVLGRQLDRQVDREAVRVVQTEGDVAGEHRGTSAGSSSGRRPTTRSAHP